MACIDCPPIVEQYGASPKNIQWTVIRGDTATLRFEFWEDDEVTGIDISAWTVIATAYDNANGMSYTLTTSKINNYIDILATPTQTASWGTGFKSVVNELAFDLQITINEAIWTPVIGTVCVLGDVTGGSL